MVAFFFPAFPFGSSLKAEWTSGPINIGSGTTVSGSVAIGAANTDRRVVVAIHWQEGGLHRLITSVTIGGVAATVHVQQGHSGGSTGLGAAIASAKVPTGTTATVSVTFESAITGCFVAAWRLIGYNTLIDSGSDEHQGSTAALSVTVSTSSPRVVIGTYTGSTDTTGQNVSWTNLTELYDGTIGGIQYSGAWKSDTSSGSLTVGATQGVIINSGNDLVVTSWKA